MSRDPFRLRTRIILAIAVLVVWGIAMTAFIDADEMLAHDFATAHLG